MQTFREISEVYLRYPLLFNVIILSILTLLTALAIEKYKRNNILKDNKKLISQSEQIKFEASKQLEELRKEHQIDLHTRKYIYESKKASYSNFFVKIDEMNTEINVKSAEKMQLFVEEYTKNLMKSLTEKEQHKATALYQKRTQSLMLDASKSLIQLKHETNEIRLHASDEVISQIDLLEVGYCRLIDEGNHLLNAMPQIVNSQSQELIAVLQAPILQHAEQVEFYKREVIKQMKKELKEI